MLLGSGNDKVRSPPASLAGGSAEISLLPDLAASRLTNLILPSGVEFGPPELAARALFLPQNG